MKKILQLIKKFFDYEGMQRQQRVIVRSAVSDTAEVISGVLQGSVLGTLLIFLYLLVNKSFVTERDQCPRMCFDTELQECYSLNQITLL